MKQEHWTMWYCCFGCPEPFSARDAWRKHNIIAHGQEAPIEDLAFLEERNVQNLDKAAGSCPVCSDIHIKDSRYYGSHVGHHLEQLALFSLPKMEKDDDDDGEQNNEAGDESGDEDDLDLDNASDDEESNKKGRRSPEAIKISRSGLTEFDHDEELNLSSSDSEISANSVAEVAFDFTPWNYQRPTQLKTVEEQKWDRSAEARHKEFEARIREETKREGMARLKQRENAEQLLKMEGEEASKDLLGKGSTATEERIKGEVAAAEIDEQEARDRIEAELKAEKDYRKKETETAAAAEAAAKAKLEAAIEAKEEAEAAAKKKMAEEAEWRELLKEEAKLKAENEARAKIEVECKFAENVAIANENALKENQSWKKAVLEEVKQKAAKEGQRPKRIEEEVKLKADKEADRLTE